MKGQNVGILYMSNADELVNYINCKDGQDIAGSTGRGYRSDDPITSFTVFSHGLVSDAGGVVSLGYNYSSDYNNNLNITTNHIARMSVSAFSSPASEFYSCNTATAGEESFAYLWHQKFGGSVMAFHGKSDYGNIMYTKWYSKYNPISWPEKIKIDNAREKYGVSISGSLYYPGAGTGANVVNYNQR